MKKIFFGAVLFFIVFALIPTQSNAATGLVQCGGFELDANDNRIAQPACGLCDVFKLANTIVNFFLFPTPQNSKVPVVPLVAVVFIVIGGFSMILGGQDPMRIEQGKKTLTAVVVGLIIVYGAWLFIGFFLQALGAASWQGITGPNPADWWQTPCPK